MDMSAAYAKGAALALPQAQISYDRFHVGAMAQDSPALRTALGATDRKTRKQLTWDAAPPLGLEPPPAGTQPPMLAALVDKRAVMKGNLFVAKFGFFERH